MSLNAPAIEELVISVCPEFAGNDETFLLEAARSLDDLFTRLVPCKSDQYEYLNALGISHIELRPIDWEWEEELTRSDCSRILCYFAPEPPRPYFAPEPPRPASTDWGRAITGGDFSYAQFPVIAHFESVATLFAFKSNVGATPKVVLLTSKIDLLVRTLPHHFSKISSIHSPLTLATLCYHYKTPQLPWVTLCGIAEQIRRKWLPEFAVQAIQGFTRSLENWDVGKHCASSGNWLTKQKRRNDCSGFCFLISFWIRKSNWRDWRRLGCMSRT